MIEAPYDLRLGDSRDVLKTLADNSIDSCVCDPPYALASIVKRFGEEKAAPAKGGVYARSSAGFMGQKWDTGEVAFDHEFWREVYRVLKPGAFVLAFGGTRTYHRIAMAIELAGFEVRDQLQFQHDSEEEWRDLFASLTEAQAGQLCKLLERAPGQMGWTFGSGFPKSHNTADAVAAHVVRGDGDTDTWARQVEPWEGWGTALKPGWEPICVARKPLIGTVAENVLQHGTGALNISACRVNPGEPISGGGNGKAHNGGRYGAGETHGERPIVEPHDDGRWPANVIQDGSPEVVEAFALSGDRGQKAPVTGLELSMAVKSGNVYNPRLRVPGPTRTDAGTAARFFYCAKASRADRDIGCDSLKDRDGGIRGSGGAHITRRDGGDPGLVKNNHPTVKPTALMAYLCRLVTQPGGLILDPFMGSGSTGRGAILEGFRFIGIEREPGYAVIARSRIAHALVELEEADRIRAEEKRQLDMFA